LRLEDAMSDETASSNLQKHLSSNPIMRRLIARFQARCARLLLRLDMTTVCEVGCGEGFFIRYLQQQFPRCLFQGSDISEPAIRFARDLVPNARFSVESIYRLPYPDNTHDLVIASEVLEHLEYPAAALTEVARVSRRYVLLTVPNEPIFRLTNLVRGKYPRTWGNHPEHIQHWNRRSFTRFVADRCSILETDTSFPWIIVLAEKRA
jgi:ubiquinone/menaquinone biosynthesis C-methylase UbiE